jgi:pimeloyl-ACP methyl ester carboxylesterase
MPRRKSNVCEELLLNKVVLRPDKAHDRSPQSLGRPFEPFTAVSQWNNRPISGWYFPSDHPRAVALVNSSNRGTKAQALDHASMLLECNCSALLYDYQGFGDSEGLADVRTLVGDAHGVLAWARQRGILTDTTRLMAVGLSLGSLVAIRLAAGGEAVCVLVLDGAVEPFRALRRSFGALGAAVAEVACSQVPEDLNSDKHIQVVTCPTLFVHGRADDISTVEDAEYLSSRTKNASLWVVEDCGHLDVIAHHRDEYRRRVEPLLAGRAVR